MTQHNTTTYASATELLAEILPVPAQEVIANRFELSNTGAPCGAVCSGECHGFV